MLRMVFIDKFSINFPWKKIQKKNIPTLCIYFKFSLSKMFKNYEIKMRAKKY
jgi:hypothetical protein